MEIIIEHFNRDPKDILLPDRRLNPEFVKHLHRAIENFVHREEGDGVLLMDKNIGLKINVHEKHPHDYELGLEETYRRW